MFCFGDIDILKSVFYPQASFCTSNTEMDGCTSMTYSKLFLCRKKIDKEPKGKCLENINITFVPKSFRAMSSVNIELETNVSDISSVSLPSGSIDIDTAEFLKII
jgi:hypothetical protein